MRAEDMVKTRANDWRELEMLIGQFSSATKRKHASAHALSRFSALYRSTCADLERARSNGYSDDLIDYLNNLAARGHNLFYVAPPSPRGKIKEFLIERFPLTIRKNAFYVTMGLALFYLPMILMIFVSIYNPDSLYHIVPRSTLESMEKMYEKGHQMGRSEDQDMAMTGFYVNNNIGIAFQCFATGIFLGLGSLFFLSFNGVTIGAVIGYVGTSDVGMNILSFIAGHGPFELTAIGLAGAAGLRIGFGFLATKHLSRMESLRRASLDAVTIIIGAALLLAAAALIEGFFSPSSLPIAVKFSFGGLCTLFLFFYLGYWPWRVGRQKKHLLNADNFAQ